MNLICECCGQLTVKIGERIKANATDFDLTNNREYEVRGFNKQGDLIYIINDAGKYESYSPDWFDKLD